MNNPMNLIMAHYARTKADVQLRFKYDFTVQQAGGIVGPGKLEQVLTSEVGDKHSRPGATPPARLAGGAGGGLDLDLGGVAAARDADLRLGAGLPSETLAAVQRRPPLVLERAQQHGLDEIPGLYRFLMPVMVGRPNEPPRQLIMPIVFTADDLLWISTGPLMDEQPAIITPGSGRSRGGLHIPGGS